MRSINWADSPAGLLAPGPRNTASGTSWGSRPASGGRVPGSLLLSTELPFNDGSKRRQPGDHVVAVGFPFGIGPSASAGVISGLKREFRSPEGKRILNNLIQFDAAANPGNSGGPLVTMDGHVVGIVAAIMNPNQQRTFIGIGFAVPIENAASAAGMPPF